MGWHKRHASVIPGLEGHLRPETLNLEAWNHAQGLHNKVEGCHRKERRREMSKMIVSCRAKNGT